MVATGFIARSDILAYFDDLKECECVVFPENVTFTDLAVLKAAA